MAFGSDRQSMTRAQASAAQIDVGLRKYMLGIYNYMASGLALTGIVAYMTANTDAVLQMLYAPAATGGIEMTMLGWAAMLAPLAFVLVLSFGINRMKASTAQALFWAFSVAMGLSLANIFLMYTGTSIARVFFISAGTFAGMSLYGYTTKKDLSGWGSYLMMGLIGIIIASIVNMFIASSALHFAISVIGVLVFVALTAYDTQKIKAIYNEGDHSEVMAKKSIMGALTLYLDFINLFLMLLRLFGDRR